MARRIIHDESFDLPALPDGRPRSSWPTARTATSRDGHTVPVTFCFTEAPAISYICAHCSKQGLETAYCQISQAECSESGPNKTPIHVAVESNPCAATNKRAR